MVEISLNNQLCYYINYLWRILATGLCFITFGIGGAILGYIIFPLIKISTSNPERKRYRAQYLIYLTFRFFIFLMDSLGLINFKFVNFDRLSEDKGCLIVSNHPTLIDYVAIVSKLKRCDNIVKEALWNNPFLKYVVQSADYIPNLQSEETFQLIKETLRNGNNILMFPEGTRSIPHQPLALKRGAAQIAIRTNSPLRVIKIDCYPSTLTKHNKWYKIASSKPKMTLTVGELIKPADFTKEGVAPSIAARHLTTYLKAIFEEEK